MNCKTGLVVRIPAYMSNKEELSHVD